MTGALVVLDECADIDTVLWVAQVRRMTGALVAVGQWRLSPSEVKDLLEARDSYPQNMMAPPDGLFLQKVEYEETDLFPEAMETDLT
ncbi:UNVERIFIED_CONTAM: hypothetical protein FKN15_008456 [Acipenser sinensis]